MFQRPYFLLLASAAGVLAAGCSSSIRKPMLLHPGPAPFQRANAEIIDPYPLPDMGPEIVGGRPLDYAVPRNEVERAQEFQRSRGIRPAVEVPLAPIPVGPAVPVTPPYAQPYPGPAYTTPPATAVPAGPRY